MRLADLRRRWDGRLHDQVTERGAELRLRVPGKVVALGPTDDQAGESEGRVVEKLDDPRDGLLKLDQAGNGEDARIDRTIDLVGEVQDVDVQEASLRTGVDDYHVVAVDSLHGRAE